jgi:ribosome-associated heat shock protein Hsp15
VHKAVRQMTPTGVAQDNSTDSMRIDKWLFHARFARSRGRAAALISDGCVRLNRRNVEKPATTLVPGDILTLVLGARVHALEIVALGTRRGPASEARLLYRDLIETGSASAAPPDEAAAEHKS